MIVTCSHCAARLQLDEARLPSRPFTVRCPKCQQNVNVQPPVLSRVGVQESVPAGPPVRPIPAPAFTLEGQERGRTEALERSTGISTEELLNALVALVRGEGAQVDFMRRQRARRALLCLEARHRESVARSLAENHYEVYLAADTSQAIERMREDKIDVFVLDAEFDAAEQGAAFLTREIMALRPAERRRLFFVQVSPTVRTADAHAAFLNNANLVVNTADLKDLPSLLDYTIRSFNELYKDYFAALRLAPL